MSNDPGTTPSTDPGDELGKAGNETIDKAADFGTALIDSATNSGEKGSENDDGKKDAA